MTNTAPRTGYAPVNDLQMYYEIHGSGQPLLLLHGAFMTVEAMGELVPLLAQTRQVIAPEFQAHGHTGDIDRPLTYEQLADDAAALLRHLEIEKADVFGYSMGGGAAVQLAIRHPEVVRKLVVASATYNSKGFHPEVLSTIATITPEMFEGSPWLDGYRAIAPEPDTFPVLVDKIKQLDLSLQDWPADSVRGIAAPTMIVIGDFGRHHARACRGDVPARWRVSLGISPGCPNPGWRSSPAPLM